jgi:hypothetical protein
LGMLFAEFVQPNGLTMLYFVLDFWKLYPLDDCSYQALEGCKISGDLAKYSNSAAGPSAVAMFGSCCPKSSPVPPGMWRRLASDSKLC